MIELQRKLDPGHGDGAAPQIDARLRLPFELRKKSRLRARLDSGEEVAILLPRGERLRGGDLVEASDGRIVEVVAEPERVLHVECATPLALLRAAYHLGNRHVPVQLGEGFLRLADDHVLAQLLHGLGATTAVMDAPFEPEAGAYGGGHAHGHEHEHEAGPRGPRIHAYEREPRAGHDGAFVSKLARSPLELRAPPPASGAAEEPAGSGDDAPGTSGTPR